MEIEHITTEYDAKIQKKSIVCRFNSQPMCMCVFIHSISSHVYDFNLVSATVIIHGCSFIFCLFACSHALSGNLNATCKLESRVLVNERGRKRRREISLRILE